MMIYQIGDGMFYLILKQWEVVYLAHQTYPDTQKLYKMRWSVPSDIQTVRSDISNTTKIALSDIQTVRSDISDTVKSVLSDIQTVRSDILDTWKIVSFDFQTVRSDISDTVKSVLSGIQTMRSDILDTWKSVLSVTIIQTVRNDISPHDSLGF